MSLPFYWVDAFSDRPFSGNPAGVVPLDTWLPDAQMQQIAFENGLAETAFFVPVSDRRFHLRWFTPTVEVKLCGHATLASAHVLFEARHHSGDKIIFDSLSGPLVVTKRTGKLELDFPVDPPIESSDPVLHELVTRALGQTPLWLGVTSMDVFAVLPNEFAVARLQPDFVAVAQAGKRGLIVTAQGSSGTDFVSRFFAPQSGVPEDPVTGSAHCGLTAYWAARSGKTVLHARQLSPRGGELWCELRGERVLIAGHARLYLSGHLYL